MSRSLNKVTLIGNLGNDPEVRSTTGGNRVATFSLSREEAKRGVEHALELFPELKTRWAVPARGSPSPRRSAERSPRIH